MAESDTWQWRDILFVPAGTVEPKREADGSITAYYPHFRYQGSAKLSRYGSGPFCKFAFSKLPYTGAVYVLAIGNKPKYVGQHGKPQRTLLYGLRPYFTSKLL